MHASEDSCVCFLARASVFDSYKAVSSSLGGGILSHGSANFGTFRGFRSHLHGHVDAERGSRFY